MTVRELDREYVRLRRFLSTGESFLNMEPSDAISTKNPVQDIFRACDSKYSIFTMKELKIEPYPVECGKEFTVHVKGVSSKPITGGKYNIDISFNGLSFNKNGEICAGLEQLNCGLKCPLPEGEVDVKIIATMPNAFSGEYLVKAEAFTEAEERIFCMEADLSVIGYMGDVAKNMEEEIDQLLDEEPNMIDGEEMIAVDFEA